METIFIDENIPYLKEILEKDYKTYCFKGRELNCQTLAQEHCNSLFVRSTTRVSENLLADTDVKFVASATSGIDHIDVEYLQNNNIHFSFANGANSNSVAEYVMFGILLYSFNKHIDVSKLTIGIIGLGNIGKKVAYYCNKIGIKILVNDPVLLDEGYKFPQVCKYCELDELLENANIITNHVPLNINGKYPTYNLLQNENLSKIKKNSLLIHSSRGGVINENDLLKFLKQRDDVELIIDVFENEPEINVPLIQRSIIATPHIAGYSHNGKINGVNMVLDDFENYFSNKFDRIEINNIINNQNSNSLHENLSECYNNIHSSRQLLEDSLRLNDILWLNSVDRRDAFDKLRKEYPIRFEYLKIDLDEYSKLFF